MSIKELATGGIATIIIGGTAFSISQGDVVNNFAADTGLSQEQAEQYVNAIPEDDLLSFSEMASDLAAKGQELSSLASDIDCINYEYEWESATLSCQDGRAQIDKFAKNTLALGKAYERLGSDSAGTDDIHETIRLLDQQNANYNLPIVRILVSTSELEEEKKTTSYNKALLQAALQSQ